MFFRINITKDYHFLSKNLNEVYSLEVAQNLEFKTIKLKQNSKFSKNEEASAPQRAREYAELEVLLCLSELSKDKITSLYNLGYNEHIKSGTNNDKRLVIKIKNENTAQIFVYKTKFVVNDSFKEKALQAIAC